MAQWANIPRSRFFVTQWDETIWGDFATECIVQAPFSSSSLIEQKQSKSKQATSSTKAGVIKEAFSIEAQR